MIQLGEQDRSFGREECERCPECGHVWEYDEPVHYADCRYYTLDENAYDEEDVTAEA